jgi:hypothetical protein
LFANRFSSVVYFLKIKFSEKRRTLLWFCEAALFLPKVCFFNPNLVSPRPSQAGFPVPQKKSPSHKSGLETVQSNTAVLPYFIFLIIIS